MYNKFKLFSILFMFLLLLNIVSAFVPEPWIETQGTQRYWRFYSDATECTTNSLEQSFIFTTYFNMYDYKYTQSYDYKSQSNSVYKDICGREYTINGVARNLNYRSGRTTIPYDLIHEETWGQSECRLESFLDPQNSISDNDVLDGFVFSSSEAPAVVNYCTIDCNDDGTIDWISPDFKRYDDIDNDAQSSWLTIDNLPKGDEYRHRLVTMNSLFRCTYGREDLDKTFNVTISCNLEKNLPNYNSFDEYNKDTIGINRNTCSQSNIKDTLDFQISWEEMYPTDTAYWLPCSVNPFCNVVFKYEVKIDETNETNVDTGDETPMFVMNLTDDPSTYTEYIDDSYVTDLLGQLLHTAPGTDSQGLDKQRATTLDAEISKSQLNLYDGILLVINLIFNMFLIIAYIIEFLLIIAFFYISVPYLFKSIRKLFDSLSGRSKK